MYSRTTIADASVGMGTHCPSPRISGAGLQDASTSANEPESQTNSVSLTWAAIRRGVMPVPASTWNPR